MLKTGSCEAFSQAAKLLHLRLYLESQFLAGPERHHGLKIPQFLVKLLRTETLQYSVTLDFTHIEPLCTPSAAIFVK